MTAFIAIVWNERSQQGEADASALIDGVRGARPSWAPRYETPGLVIFAPEARTRADMGIVLRDGAGVIMGAVFDTAASGSPLAGDLGDHDELVRSEGRRLFTRVWGRYVAFLKDKPGACVYVARDPSGALPCFMAQRGYAFVFFSDPDDIGALDLGELDIDWSYIAQRLADNRVTGSQTGVEGVTELAPGAIARIGQGRRRVEQAWAPQDVATRPLFRSATDAEAALRGAVETACAAWSECFDRIAVRLSGGLDSSIVLACVADRGREVTAVNFVTPTPEGDERDYARAAAGRAGVVLHEMLRDPARVNLEAAVSHAPTARPHLWLADGETDLVEAAYAREAGVQAYFSGRGGDNVFFRSERPYALADWVRANGIGLGFLEKCWLHASSTGRPVWRLAYEAVNTARRPPVPAMAPQRSLFLSAKAIAMLPEPAPENMNLPLGKRLHVRVIEDRLNYFDRRPHADYIYPLVSQPVIETCLGIPTYLLSPGGSDRGLARAAFAERIDPMVLARRSKGQTSAYLAQILLRNLTFLRRLLLHGALADEGMLETDTLARALSESGLMKAPAEMPRIVGLLSVEAWLRNAPSRAGRAAVA